MVLDNDEFSYVVLFLFDASYLSLVATIATKGNNQQDKKDFLLFKARE
jgi:hypothetical protein